VGHINWRDLLDEVLKDVTIVGGTPSLKSMTPTPGGTVLEAEDAVSNSGRRLSQIGGYTGTGYLDFSGASRRSWVEWTLDAPEAGTYVLEIRYALEGQDRHSGRVRVNGEESGDLVLWTTGGKDTWAWDRKPVVLRKGKNTIRLTIETAALVDHVNVL